MKLLNIFKRKPKVIPKPWDARDHYKVGQYCVGKTISECRFYGDMYDWMPSRWEIIRGSILGVTSNAIKIGDNWYEIGNSTGYIMIISIIDEDESKDNKN